MKRCSSLESLPHDCISLILSWASPIDVCRLASVSLSFAAAASSNITWHNLLPSDYRDILLSSYPNPNLNPNPNPNPNPHPHPPLIPADKRQAFQRLSHGLLLSSGRQWYTLLKCSGGVCRTLSVSAMNIAWGDDARFWRWEPSKRSCFPKVAHLIAVCWLEVKGRWKCTLPPGKYSVCWHLKVVNPRGGQGHFLMWLRPLRFFFLYMGTLLEKELDMQQLPSNGYEKWFEFEVGQIDVKGTGHTVVDLDLEFGIEEVDCSFWKGGLFLDCLTLRPSYCHEMIYKTHLDKHTGNVRGRTGVF